jgi:hypothetical protein
VAQPRRGSARPGVFAVASLPWQEDRCGCGWRQGTGWRLQAELEQGWRVHAAPVATDGQAWRETAERQPQKSRADSAADLISNYQRQRNNLCVNGTRTVNAIVGGGSVRSLSVGMAPEQLPALPGVSCRCTRTIRWGQDWVGVDIGIPSQDDVGCLRIRVGLPLVR